MSAQDKQLEANKYVVNEAIGKMPGVGWIPVNQVFYWVMIVVVVFVLQGLVSNTPLGFSFHQACFISITLSLACWALTGSKEYQYFDRFRALTFLQPIWIRGKVKIKWSQAGLPTKGKIGEIGFKWKKLWDKREQVFLPIEDCSDLVCYGQIDLQGYSVGFHLLEPRKGQFRFIFRWQVSGPHTTITEEAAQQILENYWQKGLEGLPAEEDITIEQSSFATDAERQAELDELLEGNENELAQALVYSQKTRTRQLTKKGLRKVKKSLITATYSGS